MPIANWEITREDHGLLIQIAQRVKRELKDYPDDKRTLVMDLNACHSNGCPLDFKGLLAAPMQDFSHDIYGIRKAIDRTTGKLTEDVFMPRYALANHTPVSEHDKNGHVKQPELCDITPVGCQTPEGNARVNAALKAFEDVTAEVANAATQFFDEWGATIKQTLPGLREDLHQLDALIGARSRKQEAFLRAVAGAPAQDDDAGRTALGNIPTCEDCHQPQDHCTCDEESQ